MSKKVTIQDIADALGISRNTVSKAINNTDGIADGTKEKILQKAVEMGYRPFSYVSTLSDVVMQNNAVQQEAAVFQGEIALLTGAFLNHSHFASLMLDKFQQEISKLGFIMNTHRVTPENIADRTLPGTLKLDQVKALMCIEIFDWDYAKMLCDLGIPILFVDGPVKLDGRSLPADQLYMDNTAPIFRFVRDMQAKGCTRIGFVGEYMHCQSFFERYSAFLLAMQMSGHPADPRFIVSYHGIGQLRVLIEAMDELPEVFVCANDFSAWDTMYSLAAIGKQVPEDVQICGFDDSSESRFSKPPMTTVHIHTQTMAYTAVQMLMSRMKTPSLDYRSVYVETELIYRESARCYCFA